MSLTPELKVESVGVAMVALTGEELKELELAVSARARMSGNNTYHHQICQTILSKIRIGVEDLKRKGIVTKSNTENRYSRKAAI